MNPEEWGSSPWDEYHHHHARHGGRRGRHGRHSGRFPNESEEEEQQQQEGEASAKQDRTGEKAVNEKNDSPDTMAMDDAPDPEEVMIQDSENENEKNHGKHCRGGDGERRGRGGFCRRGRGGPRGGGFHGRRGGPHSHPFFGGGGPHHERRGGPPPYDGPGGSFNFAEMMRGLTGHPLFQSIREQIINSTQPSNGATREAGVDNSPDAESFTPPVDTFSTSTSYVLHMAIPGAKKEDIAVNWDPERHVLQVTGVVHRPGDEEFINSLVGGERRIGLFEREIKLPPPGVEGTERDEVDGQGISAKMENGLLIVTVPKVEKEWTQVTKVDIE